MNLEGQQLGDFEILERLGQGGMGAVYRARQISLDRLVALKTLQAGIADDADYISRFRQEAKAAAALNHPNLVQVYYAGENDGLSWFAMEYVEGESARGRLKRKGRLDALEAIAITLHVATALEYGWRKAQLIHRDIKPDNIFLSADGEVKLGDLGLAKSAGQNQGLTVTGHSMGTPHYISPEQVQSMKDVDLRADIYSLGCTLYHFLSGSPPFDGTSTFSIMMKHVNGPVPALRETWPECPEQLSEVIGKMMQKDPAQRQQDYVEVIRDLRVAYEMAGDPQAASTTVAAPIAAAPVVVTPMLAPESPAPVDTVPAHREEASRSVSPKKSKFPFYAGMGCVVLGLAAAWFFLFQPKNHPLPQAQSQAQSQAPEHPPAAAPSHPDAPAETSGGFRPLFNGHTFAGWRSFDHTALPPGWSVVDGAMIAKGNRSWILTDEVFEDFELRLEWKVGINGNGGISFRVPVANGSLLDAPEFQLCTRDVTDKYLTGSLYNVLVQPKDASRPTGQWNSARLVVRGGRVEHWVNDSLILSYDMDSARWQEQWHAGKFGSNPSYARARKGRIGLQGWTGEVAYRQVQVKKR